MADEPKSANTRVEGKSARLKSDDPTQHLLTGRCDGAEEIISEERGDERFVS
ncbi:MAG: hypothetical protein JRN54_10750 [Nitrososphaerota archaeon]|jgi:hypothetical protein|nr:hypothetical protein [Nitrososphaerota archaeon]